MKGYTVVDRRRIDAEPKTFVVPVPDAPVVVSMFHPDDMLDFYDGEGGHLRIRFGDIPVANCGREAD